MTPALDLLARVADDVWATLAATWPYLLLSVLAAAALNVYVGTDRLSGWLHRNATIAVLGAVTLATLTPFCSCGTTAVALGMIATKAPWAPIVAFMVASPLTSPSELLLSGGLLGWPFAWMFFVGAIVLGLAAGVATSAVQRTRLLDDQARMATACGSTCSVEAPTARQSLGPGAAAAVELRPLHERARLGELTHEVWVVGRRLALLFFGFTALGYLVIEAIPTSALQSWLGGDSLASVVTAAVLGVPAYVNTEGSLPLLAGLMEGGMGPGAAMAFLVTGAGTSVGAVAGMLVIARWRVVGLTVGLLFAGAVALGAATQLVLG